METDQFTKTLDEATTGLRDDPELQLDVRAELRGHLEETAREYCAEGKDVETSDAEALKLFGSPLELAEQLLQANKGRMRLRALVRLGIRGLLIPAALIVAVLLGYGNLARLQHLMFAINSLSAGNKLSSLPVLPTLTTPQAQQRAAMLEKQLAAMHGNGDNVAQLRALWEQHRTEQDGPMYYAYYASFLDPTANFPHLNADGEAGHAVDYLAAMRSSYFYPDANYEQAMRLGEQIDPHNALYNIRLAEYDFARGILSADEQGKDRHGVCPPDVVLNQRYLELGIAEVYQAVKKPYLKYYTREIVRHRQALLPPPHLTDDYLQRVDDMDSEVLPYLGQDRNLARAIPGCARVLIKEGRVQEALPLLEIWKPLSRVFINGYDNGTVVHLLVQQAMAKMMGTESADIYRQLGRPAKAQRTMADVTPFVAQRRLTTDEKNMLLLHGSVLTNMASSVLGTRYTTANLAPLRNHEQTIVQELTVSLVVLLLTLGLLLAALRSGIAMFLLRKQRQPLLLLLPTLKQVGIVLGLGIALPIALYVVYLLSPIGGWEYGLHEPWLVIRRVIDLGLLVVALVCLPHLLALRYLLRRCRALGLFPAVRLPSPAFSLLILGWIVCVFYAAALAYDINGHDTVIAALVFIVPTVLMLALARYLTRGSRQYLHDVRAKAAYLRFTGTLARSLIPVYALAIILLAGVVQPLLVQQEAYWLAQDRITLPHTADDGNPWDGRVAQQLSTEMREAAKGWR